MRGDDSGPTGARLTDDQYMQLALEQARFALERDEVPVGAAVIREGEVIAASHNANIGNSDPSAHAEMLCIRTAAALLGSARLSDCTLYVTLEPCAMCAGAIVLARMKRVVFGAWDEKAGMAGSVGDLLRHRSLNHSPEVVGGVLAEEAGELLRSFFASRR